MHLPSRLPAFMHRRTLQGPMWHNTTQLSVGKAVPNGLAGDSQLKVPLARMRWHHLLLSATAQGLCSARVDGQLVAQQSCSLASVFPVCKQGSTYTLLLGGFKG